MRRQRSGRSVSIAARSSATDIVQVDIDRKPVEAEVEEVERRPALEHEPVRQNLVVRDLLQQVQEPQHLLERAGLVAGVIGEALQGLGRRRCHLQPLEAAFDHVDGENGRSNPWLSAPRPIWRQEHIVAEMASAFGDLQAQHPGRPAVSARAPARSPAHRLQWPCRARAGTGPAPRRRPAPPDPMN